MPKLVYLCHPISGENLDRNIADLGTCQGYYEDTEYVIVSPYNLFYDFHTMEGDQSRAYFDCIAVMLHCDEVHVYGNWEESEGCLMEIMIARINDMVIKFSPQITRISDKEMLLCHASD